MLTKSKNDRVIFGVCGGIAKTTGITSPIIRLGFIVGTVLTGSVLFWTYLVLGLILKTEE